MWPHMRPLKEDNKLLLLKFSNTRTHGNPVRGLHLFLGHLGRSIMDTIKDESPRGSEHEDEGKISSAAILKEKFKPFRCNQQIRWKRTVC
ncbi:uncharacterized protein TNCV_3095161 [Trichonephila clavipes]|nr:uncharacterized protein TNCV_3095161 [Trichonephila clavipes]